MDSSPTQHRSRRFGLVAAVAAAVAVVGVAVDLSAPQRDAFAHSSTAADFFDREVTWAQGSTIQHGEQRGRKVWIENGRPGFDPAKPDRTTGTLVSCELPTASAHRSVT